MKQFGLYTTDLCTWAVVYDIDGRYYDDRQTRTDVTAVFKYPHLAEEFINNYLPEETRERFYIINLQEVAN